MDIDQRLLSRATELFFQLGVRGVTMDEIARNLGISKKTIYQYYSNKAEMVNAVAISYFEEERRIFDQISKEAEDAIDEILRILHWSLSAFDNMSPNLVLEIEKYYPEAWEHFEQFQQEYLLAKIRQNLEWGIREGLFRQELDVNLVSRIRLVQIINYIKPFHFSSEGYLQSDIQKASVDLYLHSILSLEGLKEYQKRVNTNQTNQ